MILLLTMILDMSAEARELLGRERSAIGDLRTLLSRLDSDTDDLDELKAALKDLEGIFMLVVCGEYNAGKSSLLNALLGEQVMPEGVTPTTDRITIVTYGEERRDLEEGAFVLRREMPFDILRDVALVDTPGTNAVIKQHQELTEGFIPRADLVLFVTSADRPFTESERGFLELIRSWGKKIVVVVNKVDILEDDLERQKVLDFVSEHSRKTLGVNTQVFGMQAKKAFRAKQTGDSEALIETDMPELEAYIQTNLAGNQRLKLKLLNPLGVAQRVAENNKGLIRERLGLLSDDKRTLEEVDRQLEQYDKDMRREFEGYLARVRTVLLEVEQRGDVFFDDTVRFGRILTLLNGEKVKQAFISEVVRDADRELDRAVGELVDWFIQKNLQLWEDVMSFVQGRRKAAQDRVIGEVGGRFQYDREALIRNINERAEDVLDGFDESEEARKFADSLQGAVVQTGLMQVGGLGLGAAVLAFISATALDITGVLAGLTIVGLGFLVLPQRRRTAKRQLHDKMQTLRDGLSESLSEQFNDELERAMSKLREAIAPYTRFVRSELGRLEGLQEELDSSETQLSHLKSEIEHLTDKSTANKESEQRGV